MNAGKITFAQLSKEWLQKKKIGLKEASYVKYESLIQKYLLPYYGGIEMKAASLRQFEHKLLKIYLTKEGRKLSNSSMHSIIYILNAILKYGNQQELCRPLHIAFDYPTDIRKELSLSEGQVRHLLKYLQKNKTPSALGTMIALLTGMRLGEICSLRREQIDFQKGLIRVRTTVQRLASGKQGGTQLIITEPKSRKSSRDIPIPSLLMDYMQDFGLENLSPEQYILGKKEYPYEPRTLQYGFQRIAKECGLTAVKFHTLRHTFASHCVAMGFDAKTLSELLGHSSVSFTMSKYVHTNMEQKRRQMKLLDEDLKNNL